MTPEQQHIFAERLAAIWSEVLRIPATPDSDYFELGGDSLAALEIAERASSELQIEPEMTDFYKMPTPRQMVTLREADRGDTDR
jgi:acyl carrier protein